MNKIFRYAIILTIVMAFGFSFARADDEEIWGTYKIISATVQYLDNNEKKDAYGKHPNGYITYSKDGRMMVLVAYDGRIKLEKPDTATIEQRAHLFESMFAYAGTYTTLETKLNIILTSLGMNLGPVKM